MANVEALARRPNGGIVRLVTDHIDDPSQSALDTDSSPHSVDNVRPSKYFCSVRLEEEDGHSQEIEKVILPEPYQPSDVNKAGISQPAILDRSFGANAGITDKDGLGIVPHYRLLADQEDLPDEILNNWTRSSARRVVGKSGLYESVASDIPGHQHDFNGNSQGLLVEAAQRTNKQENSSDVSQWGTFNVSFTQKSSVLDGENAQLVSSTGGNINDRIKKTAGIFSSGEEVGSFIVERGTADDIKILMRETTNFNDVGKFDYNFPNDNTSLVAGIEAKSRVLSQNGPNGGKLVKVQVRYDPTSGTDFSGRGIQTSIWVDKNASNNGTIIHHAQIEEAPNASSPIVTGASAVTRSEDDYSIPVGDWWNENEGTIFVEFVPSIYRIGSAWHQTLQMNDSSSKRIFTVPSNQSSPFDVAIFEDGGVGVMKIENTAPAFSKSKLAVSTDGSDVRISANGTGKSSSGSNDTLFTGNSINIGGDDRSIINLHSIIYIPRALSESTINTLTN